MSVSVSLSRFDRSQGTITVQNINCGHWLGPGIRPYKYIMGAGAKTPGDASHAGAGSNEPINYTEGIS